SARDFPRGKAASRLFETVVLSRIGLLRSRHGFARERKGLARSRAPFRGCFANIRTAIVPTKVVRKRTYRGKNWPATRASGFLDDPRVTARTGHREAVLLRPVSKRVQAVAFLLDHRVALAHHLFELRAIEHGDVPAAVLDHARALKL